MSFDEHGFVPLEEGGILPGAAGAVMRPHALFGTTSRGTRARTKKTPGKLRPRLCLGGLAASQSAWGRPAPGSCPEETLGEGVGIVAGRPEPGRGRGGEPRGERPSERFGGLRQQAEQERTGASDQDLDANANQR